MEPICYIVSAMDAPDLWLPRRTGDLVIAADAGWRTLEKQGITPDLVVGDFDSLGAPPVHPCVCRYPTEKDETDTFLAARYGLEQGYQRFVCFGALGGLLDHTWANCQTLLWLSVRGAQGFLLGEGQCVTVQGPGVLAFSQENRGRISIFSAGETAEGVTLRGLRYPLEDARLTNDFPLGVSNAFTGRPAEVMVVRGRLLVIWQQAARTAVEHIVSGEAL